MYLEEWKDSIKKRDDICHYLTHFTKEKNSEIGLIDSTSILIDILSDRVLKGSTTESGFIHGDKSAVCLHDIPLKYIIKSIYRSRDKNKTINFTGIGLCFSKRFVYKNGGRPVIYDKPNIAKQYLAKDEWWRIVNLDLSNDKNIVDWTHEREWRVPNDLKFNLSDVTIIVPNNETYKNLCHNYKIKELDIINKVRGIINIEEYI